MRGREGCEMSMNHGRGGGEMSMNHGRRERERGR